jgi:ABC-type branched-subunit amino acid transport system substrate-binding protein
MRRAPGSVEVLPFAVVGLALLFSGCPGGGGVAATHVPIGVVLDRSANNAAPSWGDSASLAIEHLNAALKGQNVPLQLDAELADSASNADTTVARATELVKQKGVKGLVLDLSRSSINVNKLNYDADATKQLNVPQICIVCTSTDINNPTISKADPLEQQALRNEQGWQFRTATRQDLIIDVILRTILTAGARADGDVSGDSHLRLSLVNASDNSGRNFRTTFESAVVQRRAEAEIENVYVDPNTDPNTHDWAADLTKLTDSANDDTETATTRTQAKPDAIFESLTAGFSIALVKVYAQGDKSVPFFHAHGFRHPLVALTLGNSINGQEGVSHAVLDNGASGTVFSDALRAKTGLEPQYLDSASYDSAVLIGLGVIAASEGLANRAEVTGAQVRDAIKTLNSPQGELIRTGPAEFARAIALLRSGKSINYEGASGSLDFDAYGNALGKLVHYKGQSGRWTDLEAYDCAQPNCPKL